MHGSRWVWIVGVAGLLVAAGVQWLTVDPHHHMPWHEFALSFGLMGVAGCLAIIYVYKLLGGKLLQRREDYYER